MTLSVHSDVECRLFLGALNNQQLLVAQRSGGGGDAGSLTLRCSVTPIGMEKHFVVSALSEPQPPRHTTARSRTAVHGARRQPPGPVRRRRFARWTTPQRDWSDLLRGCGRHLCLRLRDRCWRQGYVAAEAPSLVVAPVAVHDGLDDATVQFLLAQTLMAKQQEDVEAKLAKELRELEVKVATAERRVRRSWTGGSRATGPTSPPSSTVPACGTLPGRRKKKEKRKKLRT